MSNALAAESSRYLQQHADNPVDWHPWNEAALDLARALDRPILLSIGYSACHWCHVMAHESFADEATAAVMNAHFVNIKVDREERPDLDRLYQTAHQLLTGRGGGWPLTVFLDPKDLTPFFAGTYFPRKARHGMPSFGDVLRYGAKVFTEQRAAIGEQNTALRAALSDIENATAGDGGGDLIEEALGRSRRQYDAVNGGLLGAPKFPQPRLIHLWLQLARRGRPEAGEMAERTLIKMAEGGLFDHLAGGFFRYCVDADWTIPHFEKMLYDNAELLAVYAAAAVQFKSPFFAAVARRTAAWLEAEMRLSGGGFAASLDADTAGAEGETYLWQRDECAAALGAEHQLYEKVYGLDRPPNYEGRSWHLKQYRRPAAVAAEAGRDEGEVGQLLETCRMRLYARRRARPQPGRDDKMLTAWNALAIAALADAGRLLDEPACIKAAAEALDFVLERQFSGERLYAVYAGGQSRLAGLLDDHAFLLGAVLACLRNEHRASWIAAARRLATQMTERFAAPGGGFYMTPADHEALPVRPRPWFDEATPAGNAVAAAALHELSHVLAEASWSAAGTQALHAGLDHIGRAPQAAPTLLAALADQHRPPPVVMLRGPQDEVRLWCRTLGTNLDAVIYPFAPGGAALESGTGGAVAALLCTADRCESFTGDLPELAAQLAAL